MTSVYILHQLDSYSRQNSYAGQGDKLHVSLVFNGTYARGTQNSVDLDTTFAVYGTRLAARSPPYDVLGMQRLITNFAVALTNK